MNMLRYILLLLKVSKYLIIAGSLLSAAIFISLPVQDKGYVDSSAFDFHLGDIWLEIKSVDLRDELSQGLPGYDQILLSIDRVELTLPISMELKMITVFLIAIYATFVVLIMNSIIAIVRNIKEGNSFNHISVVKLRNIALMLCTAPIVEKIVQSAFTFWISTFYQFPDFTLVTGQKFEWSILIIGLLIYVLSLAFREGLKLKEENELTI